MDNKELIEIIIKKTNEVIEEKPSNVFHVEWINVLDILHRVKEEYNNENKRLD
jgi:hypothetical protein